MEGLFENPFARMYGPYFLLFYVVLLGVLFVSIRFLAPKLINRKSLAMAPPLPAQPDPYLIAYLHGKEKDVIVLALYSLITRGYLKVMTNDDKSDVWIGQKKDLPALYALNEIEHVIFGLVEQKEKPIRQLFRTEAAAEKVEKACEVYRDELRKKGLIWTEKEDGQYLRYKILFCGIFVAIGLYKMTAAMLHGHSNVIFLLILMLAGISITKNSTIKTRASSTGDALMDQLQLAFKPSPTGDFTAQPIYMQQLQLAIFGSILLQTTRYYYLRNYFTSGFFSPGWNGNTSSGGGGYCGGSCSSGSSCGSSCGGGCGGGCGGCS